MKGIEAIIAANIKTTIGVNLLFWDSVPIIQEMLFGKDAKLFHE
jgi:hypothetical protein